jgi:hypothetical protein
MSTQCTVQVFWDVTACRMVKSHRRFQGTTVDDNVPLDMAYTRNIPEYSNIHNIAVRMFYPEDGGTASTRDVVNYLPIGVA